MISRCSCSGMSSSVSAWFQPGIVGRHADDLVVLPLLVPHLEQRDRLHRDHAAGEGRLRDADHRVERVAVAAAVAHQVAVVGRVDRRRGEEAVEDDARRAPRRTRTCCGCPWGSRRRPAAWSSALLPPGASLGTRAILRRRDERVAALLAAVLAARRRSPAAAGAALNRARRAARRSCSISRPTPSTPASTPRAQEGFYRDAGHRPRRSTQPRRIDRRAEAARGGPHRLRDPRHPRPRRSPASAASTWSA